MRTYTMSKFVKARIEKRIGELKCPVCGKPIRVGEKVVSITKRNSKPKVYHAECYEKILLKIWKIVEILIQKWKFVGISNEKNRMLKGSVFKFAFLSLLSTYLALSM